MPFTGVHSLYILGPAHQTALRVTTCDPCVRSGRPHLSHGSVS